MRTFVLIAGAVGLGYLFYTWPRRVSGVPSYGGMFPLGIQDSENDNGGPTPAPVAAGSAKQGPIDNVLTGILHVGDAPADDTHDQATAPIPVNTASGLTPLRPQTSTSVVQGTRVRSLFSALMPSPPKVA